MTDEPLISVDGLRALELLAPTLRAIPASELLRTNTSGPTAFEATSDLAARGQRERAALAAIFKQVAPELDDIVLRAQAFWAAAQQVDVVKKSTAASRRRQALVAEGKALREQAVPVLTALAGADPDVRNVLDQVRPGSGYADLADDLNRLYPRLLEQRARIEAAELLPPGAIERIGALAPALLMCGKPSGVNGARLLRDQAYTYLERGFMRVYRQLAYLYGERGEDEGSLPPLSGGRQRPRGLRGPRRAGESV